jgi:hypothetical protein
LAKERPATLTTAIRVEATRTGLSQALSMGERDCAMPDVSGMGGFPPTRNSKAPGSRGRAADAGSVLNNLGSVMSVERGQSTA